MEITYKRITKTYTDEIITVEVGTYYLQYEDEYGIRMAKLIVKENEDFTLLWVRENGTIYTDTEIKLSTDTTVFPYWVTYVFAKEEKTKFIEQDEFESAYSKVLNKIISID